ncbi:MAG: hypothetical protein V3W18_06510 [candidate division Zixibacteria bacterium]
MKRKIIFVVFVLVLSPLTIFSQQQISRNDFDRNNPKYFTIVEEIEDKAKNVNKILTYKNWPSVANTEIFDIVNPEVDLNSIIRITFDREIIKNDTIDAEIMVRGYIDTEKGTRSIEIPNYSIVGKESIEMPAKIYSVDKFFGLLNPLKEDFDGIWNTVNAHLVKIDSAYDSEYDENIRSVYYDEEYINDSPRMSPNYLEKMNKSDVKNERDILFAKSNSIEFALKELTEEKNDFQLKILADLMHWSPEYLRYEANEIINTRLPFLRTAEITDTNKDSVHYEIYKIIETVFSISDINVSDTTQQKVMDSFIRNLKDTEFHIASSGAKSGDVITLILANGKPGSNNYREHRIRLHVRDFGFSLKTSDTLLMIKRLNVGSIQDDELIGSVMEGSADSREVPLDYNYVPTAGVTFGGTYYARRSKWHGIPAFIKPGLGINVSFPRFGSKIASYSAIAVDDTTIERSISIDESSNVVDLAMGLALTLFDNTIILTYGRNLTSEKKQDYWGIGFNFLKIAGVVKDELTD